MHSKVCFINKNIRLKDSCVPNHKHNCYELVLYKSGRGVTTINEEEYSFSKNCVSFINPLTEHAEYHYEDAEVIFVGFEYINGDINIPEGVFSVPANTQILNVLEDIISEITTQYECYKIILSSKINEILVHMYRLNCQSKQNIKDLMYVKNYIEENFCQPIDFQKLAIMCGYSYDYFRHVFKGKFGLSPQNYLINQRLINSKNMLKETERNCTDVSYACGFSNCGQFSTLFKKFCGQSPKAYQLSQKSVKLYNENTQ